MARAGDAHGEGSDGRQLSRPLDTITRTLARVAPSDALTLIQDQIFHYAPDAEQEWIWITSGSVLGTILWLITYAKLRSRFTRLKT